MKIKQENARKLANIVDLDTKEFTFKPVLNKSKKVSPGLLKRNSSWLQNKAEKIALISRAEQLKEVEECTFFPQTTELRQNDGEATGINGVHEFLMRHQSARRNKSQENSIKSISTYKDLTVNEYIEAVKGLNDYLHSINIE